MHLKKEHLRRLEEIISVLISYEFGYLLDQTNLLRYLPLTRRVKARWKKQAHMELPVRVRLAFEQLGPTFVKLGQLLSIRPDLIPYPFILEFEKMQDRGPKVPFSIIRETVEKSTGAPLTKTFLRFDEEPVASASLAQVHRAQLKTKEWVAVKVRRPGIKEQMECDFEVMAFLATILQKHFPNPYQFPKIVEEFRRWTEKELDFRNELVNAKILREHAQERKLFYIPKVYDRLSSEEVFVLEYLEGISLHDIDLLRKRKYNVRRILETGCQSLVVQVFEKGFFHADPHPGNVLVLKKGQIAFIDFGIMGQFDERLRRKSLELLWGITSNNPELSLSALYAINTNGFVRDRDEFDRKIRQIMYPLQYTSLREVKITEALRNMFEACATHNVSIPVDFILFGKTIVTMEGIALRYDPDFSLVTILGETLQELMKKRFSPKDFYKQFKVSTIQLIDFFDEFPRYAKEITDRLRAGKITMDIEATDVRALTSELEHSSGNVSLGLIIAALLISSTILFQYPTYHSIAVGGYSVAVVLAAWLIRHTIYLFHKR
ncbi:AarF/ABC1/UbiB kinase family protein [Candidatus Woesearchaeota archaeon]|nr:AarF/ABC1/UbiB kinase family protein [Candidatus Woesearchaeota archaeon]